MRIIRVFSSVASAAICLVLSSCNFTTQSYNFGTSLMPGQNSAVIGVGARRYHAVREARADRAADTVEAFSVSAALAGRMGLLRKAPLGKGLDAGFLIEYPGQFGTFAGLTVLEFDMRAGLPVGRLTRFVHNVSFGWTVGAWIDNGWFVEYAAGRVFRHGIGYANVRLMSTPTDIITDNLDFTDEELLVEKSPSWNLRFALGDCIRIRRMPVLPDFIAPEIVVVLPHYSALHAVGVTGHVGMGWEFGK